MLYQHKQWCIKVFLMTSGQWTAFCTRKLPSGMYRCFNRDADTEAQALAAAKQEIDRQ